MIKIETKNYTRIQKRTAKRLFNEGRLIAITPHMYNPEGTFTSAIHEADGNFDSVVNAAEYYSPNGKIDFYKYEA